MRVAVLHGPHDEALAAQAALALGAEGALVAPLSSTLSFGPQLVVLVLWTARSQEHGDDVRRLAQQHDAVVVWRVDGAAPPAGLPPLNVFGPDSTLPSILTALRLVEIDRDALHDVAPARRRKGGRVLAFTLAVGAVAAIGAAGATAVMLDREAPLRLVAGANAPTPQPDDLRPTSSPADTAVVQDMPVSEPQPAGETTTREISSP